MVEGIMRSALCPCFIWLSAVVIISPSPIGAVETKTLVAKMTKIRLKCIVMMFLDCNVVDVWSGSLMLRSKSQGWQAILIDRLWNTLFLVRAGVILLLDDQKN